MRGLFRRSLQSFALAISLILLSLALASVSAAQDNDDAAFATLEAYRGQISIVRLGNSLTPALGMELERDDTVVTRRGTAAIRFSSDGSQLRVAPDSRVQINESAGDRDIEVFFGRLWAH